MQVFAAKEINAGYGDVIIVSNTSIDVNEGEVVAIVGPNGSGKSTLLKSILGFARLMSGSIIYQGKDITSTSPDKLVEMGIGYVPQINNVFSNLTIRENLEMGAFIIKDRKEIISDINRVFQMFPELKRREKAYAVTLSGGERQMLAIARAMMANPKVLMLDEPLASLSPKAVDTIAAKLELVRKTGTAMIIIEQKVKRVLEFASRAFVLVNGSCVLSGEAKTILSNEDAKRKYLGFSS